MNLGRYANVLKHSGERCVTVRSLVGTHCRLQLVPAPLEPQDSYRDINDHLPPISPSIGLNEAL
jgi:hypothetical protein